jgi:arylsulfatase A-like enzyme
MLLTGKYPHANGVLYNCNSNTAPYGNQLPETARCWSDILKQRGYSLGYIGKWHLDAPRKPYVECYNNTEELAWNEWCPPHRRHGFDFWYSYGTFDRHMTPMYWATDSPREAPIRINQWGPTHEADLAIKYLKNEGGRYRDPARAFALVVSMNPPHTGYTLYPKKYLERYASVPDEVLFSRPNIPPADEKWGEHYRQHIRNYFAMVTGVDEQFGRILQALDEAGLTDDTIVVFTSDHGDCLGIHDEITKNNHYEESLRIPLMIRWPGRIKPRRDELLLSVPDLYPTLLDLMGLAGEIPADVQGASHAQLILTGSGARPTAQLYLKVPKGQPAWGRRGVRTRRHTLVTIRREGAPVRHVLHDNRADPYQLKNIAEQRPDLVEKLTNEELKPWLARTKDPWLES